MYIFLHARMLYLGLASDNLSQKGKYNTHEYKWHLADRRSWQPGNKIKSNKLSSIDETINYLILHQSDEIANLETISTKTFYNYVHQGRTSIKPIDLPRMVRKKTKKNWKTYIPKRKKELPLQKDQIISMKEVNLVIGKVIWLLVPEMDKMELILLY